MLFRFVILLVTFWMPSVSAFSADLDLADDGLSAGYATLTWQEVDGKIFELKENTTAGWRTIYSGEDRATTLSGLKNGTYEFALWVDGAQRGEPLALTVKHHPLSRAWIFFGIGALMFVALVSLLMRGPSIEPAAEAPSKREE